MSELLRQKVVELARRDGRYHLEAYFFVFHSLQFAQEELCDSGPPESLETESPETLPETLSTECGESEGKPPEQHITGQQLCEAARQLALRQFGYLAESVLSCWGITKTADFGEIVYGMIRDELMKKTSDDRREDFENVYDFGTGLAQGFRISLPD